MIKIPDMTEPQSKKPNEKFFLLAAKMGHKFVVEAFLNRPDIDFNMKTSFGQTALSLAAERGHTDIVALLSSREDVEVNMQDLDGQTALGWATFKGHVNAASTLLKNPRVRVDVADIEGRTPVSWAILRRRTIILGLLLDRLGIDPQRDLLYVLLAHLRYSD